MGYVSGGVVLAPVALVVICFGVNKMRRPSRGE
jgi:hypothetical protein